MVTSIIILTLVGLAIIFLITAKCASKANEDIIKMAALITFAILLITIAILAVIQSINILNE